MKTKITELNNFCTDTLSFETIIQQIKNYQPSSVSSDFNETLREDLIKIISYIKNSNLDVLHRISMKQLAEITGRHDDKAFFIDVFFYLCGCEWHLFEPVFTYCADDSSFELSEDDMIDFRQHKVITLSDSSTFLYDPKKIKITFTLSNETIKLKQSDNN